jgi:2-polyprenyl-3-methyl-5-hydroxy-6-metoxy-1,4-benzoquinol methylase
MNKVRTFFKKLLYGVFGYQPSINWAKRVRNLGVQSVYNNTTPESERENLTNLQNDHYSTFLQEVVADLNDGRRILDYGCGWGRHFKLLQATTGSNQIVGYDPFGDLFEVVADGYSEIISSRELLGTLARFDLVFIHLVIGGFNDKQLRLEFELIECMLNPNGFIFIVEACSDNEKLDSSWKIRKPEAYFSLVTNFTWETKDIIHESGDDLYIMIGKKG